MIIISIKCCFVIEARWNYDRPSRYYGCVLKVLSHDYAPFKWISCFFPSLVSCIGRVIKPTHVIERGKILSTITQESHDLLNKLCCFKIFYNHHNFLTFYVKSLGCKQNLITVACVISSKMRYIQYPPKNHENRAWFTK